MTDKPMTNAELADWLDDVAAPHFCLDDGTPMPNWYAAREVARRLRESAPAASPFAPDEGPTASTHGFAGPTALVSAQGE